MEYKRGILNILLIDEPDAHLHAELQVNLVDVIKKDENSQIFIISHNERFLSNIDDKNIIFINKDDKKKGIIKPLSPGYKSLVLENLVENMNEIEQIRYVHKLVLVEGSVDLKYLSKLNILYKEIYKDNIKNVKFIELKGIDKLYSKLNIITNTFRSLIPNTVEWIIIRDRDLIPSNRLERSKNETLQNIFCFDNKKVIFQQGYELYSTFFSEQDRFILILSKYYGFDNNSQIFKDIQSIISTTLEKYTNDILNPLEPLYDKMQTNYERQKNDREGTVYDKLNFTDYLKEFNKEKKPELIMEKKLVDELLNTIHKSINTSKNKPSMDILFDVYLNNINVPDDLYKCHLSMLKCINI